MNTPTMSSGLAQPSLDNQLLLFVPRGETALDLRQRRRRDTTLARLRSGKLDPQLAAGMPPETGRLAAVRATMLVTPASRELLASCWERLLVTTKPSFRILTSRVPVSISQVRAAQEDIRSLVDALRRPGPVTARGVATATVLLQDGAGPVYSEHGGSLTTAVRDAQRHLETWPQAWAGAAARPCHPRESS